MQNESNNILERFNRWVKNSITLKLITIAILVLLLLIPESMVRSIIREREMLNEQAVEEVSSKWANGQLLTGPILTVPCTYTYQKGEEVLEGTRYWHILPEDLDIQGVIDPQKLRRGIYEIVVYKSNLQISGSFIVEQTPDIRDIQEVLWNKAFLTIGLSDLRGIEEQVRLNLGGTERDVEPGSRIQELVYSGITVPVRDLAAIKGQPIAFSYELNLQGSQFMNFTPLGSETEIRLQSSWDAPSFNGNFLPDEREVTAEGFTASWKVLQLNRSYPQSFVGNDFAEQIKRSTFGVDLILPLDDYQKTMRSAKYAVMIIALTFLIFFLVEVLQKQKIHPFQYALVGLALVLFYILLVSISEHTNFNIAYLISTAAVLLMVSLYSLSVFKTRKLTLLLVATLLGIYGFLFVTLQLTDYALLMGSVGLTLILGATMYFTRNIDWYQLNRE